MSGFTLQLMMRQQDQQLDSVLNTVSTLKEVALTMGEEIEDQVGCVIGQFCGPTIMFYNANMASFHVPLVLYSNLKLISDLNQIAK
jgi:hypothetical protein